MGFLANWKTWFVMHLLLGYIFIMSGLITCFFLLIAYICLWRVNKRLYRKFATRIAYLWWSQFTFLGQWWAPSKCHIFFENPNDFHELGTDHTIVIMNHKYEVDWLMTMMLAERYGILGGTKIYGKAMLKHIPILGWAWSFTESIFLKREWTTDKKNIIKDLAYICDYPDDYWVTLLLFCEGTRFTETKLELSNKVAREKGLKELKHHLLPRTKGFVLSINGVKDHIHTITDLTVGFRNEGTDATMMNLLNGRGLCAEIYIRRIPTKSVPVESDVQTAEWLHRLYQEKDEIFDNFKSNGNHFTIGTCIEVPRRRRDLVTWCTWAVVLLVPLFHCIINIIVSGSLLSQGILVVVMALLTLCIKLLIGVTHIEKASDYGSSPVHQPNKVVHAKSL